MRLFRKPYLGFSLVEVFIALGISALVIVSFFVFAKRSSSSMESSLDGVLSDEKLERVRLYLKKDLDLAPKVDGRSSIDYQSIEAIVDANTQTTSLETYIPLSELFPLTLNQMTASANSPVLNRRHYEARLNVANVPDSQRDLWRQTLKENDYLVFFQSTGRESFQVIQTPVIEGNELQLKLETSDEVSVDDLSELSFAEAFRKTKYEISNSQLLRTVGPEAPKVILDGVQNWNIQFAFAADPGRPNLVLPPNGEWISGPNDPTYRAYVSTIPGGQAVVWGDLASIRFQVQLQGSSIDEATFFRISPQQYSLDQSGAGFSGGTAVNGCPTGDLVSFSWCRPECESLFRDGNLNSPPTSDYWVGYGHHGIFTDSNGNVTAVHQSGTGPNGPISDYCIAATDHEGNVSNVSQINWRAELGGFSTWAWYYRNITQDDTGTSNDNYLRNESATHTPGTPTLGVFLENRLRALFNFRGPGFVHWDIPQSYLAKVCFTFPEDEFFTHGTSGSGHIYEFDYARFNSLFPGLVTGDESSVATARANFLSGSTRSNLLCHQANYCNAFLSDYYHMPHAHKRLPYSNPTTVNFWWEECRCRFSEDGTNMSAHNIDWRQACNLDYLQNGAAKSCPGNIFHPDPNEAPAFILRSGASGNTSGMTGDQAALCSCLVASTRGQDLDNVIGLRMGEFSRLDFRDTNRNTELPVDERRYYEDGEPEIIAPFSRETPEVVVRPSGVPPTASNEIYETGNRNCAEIACPMNGYGLSCCLSEEPNQGSPSRPTSQLPLDYDRFCLPSCGRVPELNNSISAVRRRILGLDENATLPTWCGGPPDNPGDGGTGVQ